MKLIKNILAAVMLCGSYSASATPIVLDFEGAGNAASLLDFYNGGTDSQGNSGANLGVNFASNALSVIQSAQGGTGNFINNPSGRTVMFFLTGSAVLNYSAGFTTGFSFFYSSSTAAVINVWDGLNATGNLLGSLNLTAQFQNNGCTSGYCNWTASGINFLGTARSIDFGGGVNAIGYDDITFGSSTPGGSSPVPVPATLGLFSLALAGLVARRKISRG